MIDALIVVASSCSNRCEKPARLIWQPAEIEGSRITKENPQASLRQLSTSWRQKPPFYNGPMPIQYTSFVFDVIPSSMAMGMGGIVVMDDYGEFKNLYVYPESMSEKVSGIPIGAVTMSKTSNEVVAEAKLLKHDSGGIEVEEFHYNNCAGGAGCCLIFRSKSLINRFGYKEKEDETNGRKEKDYYFMWPMGGR